MESESDWREPAERIAAFVADMSAGDMESAWQKYRVMLPEVPLSPKSPFDPDPFEGFLKSIGRFPPEVDSFALIAERRISPNSRRMYFLAEGKLGPVLVETLVYRHRNEWFFSHFSYMALGQADAAWHKLHEDVLPLTKLPEPVPIALPKPPAAEAVVTP